MIEPTVVAGRRSDGIDLRHGDMKMISANVERLRAGLEAANLFVYDAGPGGELRLREWYVGGEIEVHGPSRVLQRGTSVFMYTSEPVTIFPRTEP